MIYEALQTQSSKAACNDFASPTRRGCRTAGREGGIVPETPLRNPHKAEHPNVRRKSKTSYLSPFELIQGND